MTFLWMMKKNKTVLLMVCVVMVMILAAGCGKNQEPPILVDLSSEKAENDTKPEAEEKEDTADDSRLHTENDSQEAEDARQSKEPETQIGGEQTSGSEELTGSVSSVSQDSFVISKSETYSYDGYDVEVAAAPGSEGEELVTVYVNQNCGYLFKTVKNSGINPEDIAAREGSFDDLKEGIAVVIEGHWQDGSFYADSVVMSEFI